MYFVYIHVCMCLYIRVRCVHTCVYIQASVLFQVSNPNCSFNVDQDPRVDVGLLVHEPRAMKPHYSNLFKSEPGCQSADLALITRKGVCGHC